MVPTEVRPIAREEEGETDPHGTISCEERGVDFDWNGGGDEGYHYNITQLLNNAYMVVVVHSAANIHSTTEAEGVPLL